MPESEIWKDVVGYEGLYKVSDKGNVHSVARKDTVGRKCGGRTLKRRYSAGYAHVALHKNGKMQDKYIHRLVAEAFIPNPEKLPEVNHKDETPSNNELSNLEWCTSRYNTNYGTRNERASQTKCKKVKAINIETGEVLIFNSTLEADDKGYNSGGVAQACNGTYKSSNGKLIGGDGRTYKGHKWSYEEEN